MIKMKSLLRFVIAQKTPASNRYVIRDNIDDLDRIRETIIPPTIQ